MKALPKHCIVFSRDVMPEMAEREGFEPSGLPVQRFSSSKILMLTRAALYLTVRSGSEFALRSSHLVTPGVGPCRAVVCNLVCKCSGSPRAPLDLPTQGSGFGIASRQHPNGSVPSGPSGSNVYMSARMPDTRQIALLSLAIAFLGPAAAARAQQFEVPIVARSAIVNGTNDYRQQKGLAPLRQSTPASQVAQAYATYLARTRKTGHGADGRNPVERLRAADVKFCKFRGENWHRSWTRPKPAPAGAAAAKAMRFWKKSPGHERALSSASTEIGVGVVGWRHGNQWYYVEVQMFLDTSCFVGAGPGLNDPPRPLRNPRRLQLP